MSQTRIKRALCRSIAVILACGLLGQSASALDPDDPALVGVWLFDDGGGEEAKDEINDNTGELIFEEDFEWGEGKFNGAITAFGGGSIDVPDSDSLASIEEALTVAAWFRVDADSATGVRKQNAFLLEDQSGSEPIPDGFSFRVWTDQGITPGFYGQTELEQGEWYHVAGTYDSETGAVELYINGEPESMVETGALDAAGAEWEPEWGGLIGQGQTLQLKYGPEDYTGAMDEVVILNRAITQEEVKQLMNGWNNLAAGAAGDYNNDGAVDALDIDLQAAAMKDANVDLAVFDENSDGVVDINDREIWVNVHKNTWMGDSNLDGEFNSGDLVAVFTAGKYNTGEMATWGEGDWNGDMEFGSGDLVTAFQAGGFELGPRAAAQAVPEPSTFALLGIALLSLALRGRTKN